MNMIDFYEKYWTVEGKPVPPLDEKEKAIWTIASQLEVNPYIKVWRRKYGWVYEINPMVKEVLDAERMYE